MMTRIISKLSSGWHLVRILRTLTGLAALIEGIRMQDYAIGMLGIFFLYQGITDTGCCSAAGCVVRPPKEENKKVQEITYEEIK